MGNLFGRRLATYVGNNTILARVWPAIYIYLLAQDSSLTPSLLRRGTWEWMLNVTILRLLRRGGTFVDIGANCGYHALAAARRLGKRGTVLAIEPQAQLCDLIQRSVEANGFLKRMRVLRLGIGARDETGSLGKLPNLTGSASFYFGDDVPDREEVRVVPLPLALSIASERFGRPVEPDAIKIDVEGFEFEVWDGMKEWTRTRTRLAIVLEFSPYSYRSVGRDPLELLHQFREYGFKLYRVGLLGPRKLGEAECARISAGDRQFDILLRK